MLTTTLVYSLQNSQQNPAQPPGQAGFRLVIAIVDAVNIDPKVFVYHREVTTAGGDTYLDTFNTVASVADLEDYPTAPTDEQPFYRDSTLDLIFRTAEERQDAQETILMMIERLKIANDLVINLAPPSYVSIPEGRALLRYWGTSVGPTVSDADIQGFESEPDGCSRVFWKAFNPGGLVYLYYCYRAELGLCDFTLDDLPVDMTLTVQEFTNIDGYIHRFNVYRTTAQQSGSNLVLASTPDGDGVAFQPDPAP